MIVQTRLPTMLVTHLVKRVQHVQQLYPGNTMDSSSSSLNNFSKQAEPSGFFISFCSVGPCSRSCIEISEYNLVSSIRSLQSHTTKLQTSSGNGIALLIVGGTDSRMKV